MLYVADMVISPISSPIALATLEEILHRYPLTQHTPLPLKTQSDEKEHLGQYLCTPSNESLMRSHQSFLKCHVVHSVGLV